MSNRSINAQEIRPYKVEIFGLQDDYIGTLQSFEDSFLGQIVEPRLVVKDDGTQTFTCRIPKFYIDPKTNNCTPNPRWQDAEANVLAENIRVLKVFIRTDGKPENDKVYPMIIDTITDRRDSHFAVYKYIEASGLAFAELGKQGYKLELTSFTIEDENAKAAEKAEAEGDGTFVFIEPTIQYWLDKVFPRDENGKWLTPWCYEIRMDYSHYAESREPDQVYEDAYVNGWDVVNEALVPTGTEQSRIKARYIECSNSNKYNITQDIAQAFGVFCRYEYKTDLNGKFVREWTDENKTWTGKKVIFYNKAIKSENPYVIDYEKNLQTIERKSEGSNIYSKLYVKPIEASNMTNGYVTIADVAANPTYDEFILNFDYLKNVGAVKDWQLSKVKDYEVAIREKNTALAQLAPVLEKAQAELNEQEAKVALNDKQIASAQENKVHYETLMNGVEEEVVRSKTNPRRAAICRDEYIDENGETKYNYYIEFNSYDAVQLETIAAYLHYPTESSKEYTINGETIKQSDANFVTYKKPIDETGEIDKGVLKDFRYGAEPTEQLTLSDDSFYAVLDDDGFLRKLYFNMSTARRDALVQDFGEPGEDNSITWQLYIVFAYRPRNKYEARVKQYEALLEYLQGSEAKPGGTAKALKDACDAKEAEYNRLLANQEALLAEKEKLNQQLENVLGPALREGYWNPSEYKGVSEPHSEEKPVEFDGIPKEGEEKLTDKSFGIEESKQYRNYLIITDDTNKDLNKEDLSSLSITLTNDKEKTLTLFNGPNAGFDIIFTKLSGADPVRTLVFNQNLVGYLPEEIPAGGISVSATYNFTFNDKTEEKATTLEINNFGNVKTRIQVWPRLTIDKKNVQYNADTLVITRKDAEGKDITLRKFYDYYYHIESGYPTYTFKITENNPFINFNDLTYNLSYETSAANEMLYLDARQVAKDNSIPRYSYSLTLSNLPHDFKHIDLSQLVYINDYSLGIHAATGYVNEITYHLDEPWEDEINVQNYKTKFEDLFNTIVAQSEAMKNGQPAISNVVSNFGADGTIKGSVIQTALANNDFYFNYSSTGVEITPTDGIILTNNKPYTNGVYGQIVLQGGGIFISNSEDADGNRIWSTGITPDGINANLLTAGQINTDLIKIYAGDDIAFSWNKDGIYAYCDDGKGGYNDKSYVRFSKEGLHATQDGKDLVYLTWDGLYMRNKNGERTFELDTDGNILMSGTLQSFDYRPGINGAGWRIDRQGNAEFNNVQVRGTIAASVFRYDETTAVGGEVWVAPTLIIDQDKEKPAKIYWSSTTKRLILENVTPFVGKDRFNLAGRVWAKNDIVGLNGKIVDTKDKNNVYEFKNLRVRLSESTFTSTDTIYLGSEITCVTEEDAKNIQIYDADGNPTTFAKTGIPLNQFIGTGSWHLIYLGSGKDNDTEGILITAMKKDGPYIDVFDDEGRVSRPIKTGPVVRLGKLDGLKDIEGITKFFTPTGYGLYSDNVYLTGAIYATSGKIGSLSIDQLENKQLKVNVDLGNEKNFIINKKTGTNVNDSEKPTIFVKAYIDNEYLEPGTKVGEGLLEPFSSFNFQYQYYDPETEKWNNFSATSSPISWEKGYNETGKTDCTLTASVNVILTRQYRTVITVTYKNNNETQTIYSQPYMFSLIEDGNNGEDGDNGKDSVIYTITPDITIITRDLVTSISPTSFNMIANKVSGAITEKIKVTHTDSYRIVVFAVRPGTNGTVSYEAINPKGGGAKGYDANVTTGNKSSIPSLTLTNYFAKGQDYGDAIALILRLYNFSGLGTNATYTDATLLTQTTVNFTLGEDLRALGTLSADKKEVLVADGRVTANSIVAGAITAGKLAAGAISTGVISGGNEIYIMAGEGTNYNKAPSFDAKSWTPYSGATKLTWTTGDQYASALSTGFKRIWDNNKYTTGVKIDGTGVYIQGTNSKLVVDMTNFKIDSSGNVTINGVINAKNGGTIGGWNIGSSTIYSGDVNADVDPNYVCLFGGSSSEYSFYAGGRHGIDAKFWVKKDGSIKATSGTIGEWTITTDKLHSGTADGNYVALGTSGDYRIWAGKKDAASAPFSVTKKGELKASSGTIGGWKIGTNKLEAGSSTSYVALNSNPSKDSNQDSTDNNIYRMWAGNENPSSAPFRITKEGKVYLTSIVSVDENDATKTKTMSLYDYGWKLYHTLIKSYTEANGYVTSMVLTNGKTINFKRAAALSEGKFTYKGGSGVSIKTTFTLEGEETSDQNLTLSYRNGYPGIAEVQHNGSAIKSVDLTPTEIVRTGYSTMDKTVTVKTLNSYGDLLTDQTIDATPIANYYTPDGVYYSSHSIKDKTISVRVTHGSRNLLTNQSVDASKFYDAAYNAGASGVTLSNSTTGGGVGSTYATVRISASNGKTRTVTVSVNSSTGLISNVAVSS